MPTTTATPEIALLRAKTYLRSTGQERLNNHLMLLHIHKEHTDISNLTDIANEIDKESEHRFGKFQVIIISIVIINIINYTLHMFTTYSQLLLVTVF